MPWCKSNPLPIMYKSVIEVFIVFMFLHIYKLLFSNIEIIIVDNNKFDGNNNSIVV